MKILKEIYEEIINEQRVIPPETGGIIGGNNDIVLTHYFDKGNNITKMCSYAPNTREINEVIKTWQKNKISFMGIYHTHFWSVDSLSDGDISYIYKILKNMPTEIEQLYFPLVVMPDRKIVCYNAKLINEKLTITRDQISIV